jgi:uncharacterized membrane protein
MGKETLRMAMHDVVRQGMERISERGNRGPGGDRMAQALGWFSIGLGVAELAMPNRLGGMIGVRNNRGLMRMMGVREIASGVGILSGKSQPGWVWSRVGGDMLDLALLGAALTGPSTRRGRTLGAVAAVAGVTALDALTARRITGGGAPQRTRASVIVNKSAEECYSFWRSLENLPKFMDYLESVRSEGNRSHWVARVPAVGRVEWEAEIIEDRPNERIAWRSLPGADVPNSGFVTFERAPGGRGTIIRSEMEYRMSGMALAAPFAKLIGKDPAQMAYKDLRRFKQAIETGEVIRTEGQPSGRGGDGTGWLDAIGR